MGYIQLNTVTFSPTPSTAQGVAVHYKFAGEPDANYIQSTASANVLANGTFSPAYVISSLTDGTEYTVRVTPNCGGAAFAENFFAGAATTTTTEAPTTTTTTEAPTTTTTTTTN